MKDLLMLDHCTYDKIKLLHELSTIVWFLEKHGKSDAKEDAQCSELFEKMAKDLNAYIDELNKQLHRKC